MLFIYWWNNNIHIKEQLRKCTLLQIEFCIYEEIFKEQEKKNYFNENHYLFFSGDILFALYSKPFKVFYLSAGKLSFSTFGLVDAIISQHIATNTFNIHSLAESFISLVYLLIFQKHSSHSMKNT